MFDFIADLDAFFCENYADYDKLCVLSGYRMPVMQATRIGENGREYGYTLPMNTMRLALQEKKDELLVALKKQMVDKTFSFSFAPIPFFDRVKNIFSKVHFLKVFKRILQKYNIAQEKVFEGVDIAEEIQAGILKGVYLPTKNLILSLALTLHFTYELEDWDFIFYCVIKDILK